MLHLSFLHWLSRKVYPCGYGMECGLPVQMRLSSSPLPDRLLFPPTGNCCLPWQPLFQNLLSVPKKDGNRVSYHSRSTHRCQVKSQDVPGLEDSMRKHTSPDGSAAHVCNRRSCRKFPDWSQADWHRKTVFRLTGYHWWFHCKIPAPWYPHKFQAAWSPTFSSQKISFQSKHRSLHMPYRLADHSQS